MLIRKVLCFLASFDDMSAKGGMIQLAKLNHTQLKLKELKMDRIVAKQLY